MVRSNFSGPLAEYPTSGINLQSHVWDWRSLPSCLDNRQVDPQQDVRRAALRAWIDKHHKGNVAAFSREAKLRQPHIAEMLVSKRVLGEKAARSIEKKAGMPPRHLEGVSGGTKEAKHTYHGILLTRAGALLGAEWEKLDIDRRAHYEQQIYAEVAQKVRNSRKGPASRHAQDED